MGLEDKIRRLEQETNVAANPVNPGGPLPPPDDYQAWAELWLQLVTGEAKCASYQKRHDSFFSMVWPSDKLGEMAGTLTDAIASGSQTAAKEALAKYGLETHP